MKNLKKKLICLQNAPLDLQNYADIKMHHAIDEIYAYNRYACTLVY